jgi:beta-phosphoglucomutase-like phosphatase (HAD superfamily)
MFDAVIFDLDGTLVDTEAVALELGRRCLLELGHQPYDHIFHQMIGKDGPTSDAILVAAYPDLDLPAFDRLWRGGFDAAIESHLPLKPGVHDLLARIAQPMALCTSSRRASALRKLTLAGLDTTFREVVALEDVRRAKPHPEPYLTTAARLGLPPARCLVFEDSETGAAAARAAGCVVVQVPDIVPATGDHAHHVASSLLDGARLCGLIR